MIPSIPGILASAFIPVATHTVTVSSDLGEHTWRGLATADGWNGADDLILTVNYNVTQNGTLTGVSLIRTGTIPNDGGKSNLTSVIANAVELRAFGGGGGDGGSGDTATAQNGLPGGNGQDVIGFNTANNVPGTITNNGIISAGGGGGGGGGGGSTGLRSGGGGGGGARNGAGGASAQGNPGSVGGDTTGGAGGAADVDSGAGGAGGNRGVDGTVGDAGQATGGAKGNSGIAIKKSGHTVSVGGTGTIFGAVTS